MLIIYLDTSALLKRYIREAGAGELNPFLAGADEIATVVITRVETASAVARLVFSHSITEEEGERLWNEFCEDWESITRLQVTSQNIERAASLARQYRLRGYDAVHLASAILWQENLNLPVTLATFDRDLWRAARQFGMDVWPDGLVA